MRNTLNEEKLKEKFEGDDNENIDSLELKQIVIFVKYYVKLDEKAKNRKPNDLHDPLGFNQTAIF
eukprot:15113136-Heterocapsa_arctica.AAC.1